MTTIAAPDSPSRGRSAICRMYTDVQARGSIQVVLSLISTAGTMCCCASASAEITAASASTTAGVNPDRRTRQAKKADHKHSAVSGAPSHQPEICFVAASTATAVNKTAPPRRRPIEYQPASRCRAWSDGPANRGRRARPQRPAGGASRPPTESAAGSTGRVCGRTGATGTATIQHLGRADHFGEHLSLADQEALVWAREGGSVREIDFQIRNGAWLNRLDLTSSGAAVTGA